MVMSTSSINGSAQILQLLGVSNRSLSQNLAALASGNRLTTAATDVSALSIATALQAQNSGLRSASSNIAQAQSFLQVADGGLAEQQSIVDRMTALATQANSGALSAAGRKGLNTEFQQLRQELDRISGNTNFNGVNLLNGSLSSGQSLQTNTALGNKASGDLSFTSLAVGNTIQLNGQTVTAGVDFAVTGALSTDVASLANDLNTSGNAAFSNYSFTATGNALSITSKVAGEAGNQFFINRGTSTAGFTVSNGQALASGTVYSLQGGTNTGLSAGDVSFSGAPADNILDVSKGQAASVTATFNTANDIRAGETLRIDNGEGGFVNFTFSNSPASASDIQLGSTLEETLQNAANVINGYTGANDYGVRQLNATVSGNTLKLSNVSEGNPLDVSGAALNVQLTTTGGSLSSNTLNNGTTGALNVSNVTSKDFIGNISGFTATVTGADSLTLRVQVGNDVFTANVVDTSPTGNTTVRFTSATGGSFDITLKGGKGQTVNGQAEADTFASRLNNAFSTLNFTQTREVSSYQPTGSLLGSSLSVTGSNLSNLEVRDVKVSGGAGGLTTLSFQLNGTTYTSGNIGRELGAGETVTLTSTTNPNEKITFTNGNTAFDVSSNAGAASLQSRLKDALGVSGNAGAQFQVGASSGDVMNLTIGNTSSDALLNGDVDLLSASNAAEALNALSVAGQRLTSERANVGAFQQSLGFTGNNVADTLFNQEAARAELQDTDLALAALQNALLTTRSQSGIATLVQSNRLQSNILGLLK
jgi:flagellin